MPYRRNRECPTRKAAAPPWRHHGRRLARLASEGGLGTVADRRGWRRAAAIAGRDGLSLFFPSKTEADRGFGWRSSPRPEIAALKPRRRTRRPGPLSALAAAIVEPSAARARWRAGGPRARRCSRKPIEPELRCRPRLALYRRRRSPGAFEIRIQSALGTRPSARPGCGGGGGGAGRGLDRGTDRARLAPVVADAPAQIRAQVQDGHAVSGCVGPRGSSTAPRAPGLVVQTALPFARGKESEPSSLNPAGVICKRCHSIATSAPGIVDVVKTVRGDATEDEFRRRECPVAAHPP